MNGRFSSTTTISCSPSAKRRAISPSKGCIIDSCSRRMPLRRRPSSSRPSSAAAASTSWYTRPEATMPSHASGEVMVILLRPLAMA